MNELISEAKWDMAYADLQRAYGGLISSIGIEYTPLLDSETPLEELARAVEQGWTTALERHRRQLASTGALNGGGG